ncbi:MAG: helix-turn-helix domain-containing protein [Thermomicrobiales bacterium]
MISDQARRIARLHLDVGYALFRARELAGLSVETLAERTGLTPDRIVMIEEGDTTSLTEVAQMCEAMKINLASLFSETTERTRRNSQVTRVA